MRQATLTTALLKNIAMAQLLVCGLQLANAQTVQSCNDRIDRSTPTNRFTLSSSGALLEDLRTGRVWQRCPLGYDIDLAGTPDYLSDDRCIAVEPAELYWPEALTTTADFNSNGGLDGFTDWRVPTIHELASITERRCHHPSLNLSVFPPTGDYALVEGYWSSTPAEPNFAGGTAWIWRFDRGEPLTENMTPGVFAIPQRVRLVRGP